MRCFFALPLEGEVRAPLHRAAERLRRDIRMAASWVEPCNFHVTLRFLGEIDPMLTVELKALAIGVAAESRPFTLDLRSIGAFPSLDRPRVLWIGGETPVEFRDLAERFERGVVELGLPPEQKPALAHVTIARVKGAADPRLARRAEEMNPLAVPPCRPTSVALMQSELGPSGARYTTLFSVRLGGAAGA